MCVQLGDEIHRALSAIGVTPQRVEYWLGNCRCDERRRRLNQLGNWAARVISGKVSHAKEYLEQIVG